MVVNLIRPWNKGQSRRAKLRTCEHAKAHDDLTAVEDARLLLEMLGLILPRLSERPVQRRSDSISSKRVSPMCGNGLHLMTEANTIWDALNRRTCKECLKTPRKRKKKTDEQ